MKFCVDCKRENEGNTYRCSYCGGRLIDYSDNENSQGELNSCRIISEYTYYEKIGGWLILVGIGRFLAPILMFFSIIAYCYLFTKVSSLDKLLGFNQLNGHSYKMYVTINFLLVIVEFIANIFILYLFLKKKKAFPTVMIAYMAIVAAFAILENTMFKYYYGSGFIMTAQANPVFGSIVNAAIWIPYFLSSARVKGTFVN